jgi:hypothetical protein
MKTRSNNFSIVMGNIKAEKSLAEGEESLLSLEKSAETT